MASFFVLLIARISFLMKNIFLLLFLVLLSSCKAQNSSEVSSLRYFAQTRGFLVDIDVNNKEIVYNNNDKINTISIDKTTWNSLLKSISHLDFNELKNYTIPEELLATDRAIKAELTFTTVNDKHLIEFIHGNPPEELKEIIRELFSAVSE